MVRADARRSGFAKHELPLGVLRTAWKKALGTNTEYPAITGADGSLVVLATHGEIVFLDADGNDTTRFVTRAPASSPTLLSDGTVVFTTSAGDVEGWHRADGRRFVAHVGAERNPRAGALPLDDGGVVVASGSNLVLLDAAGNVRVRATLPEVPAAPLLASDGRVIAVGSNSVFAWTPGTEPVRVGSLGGSVDGGVALGGARSLVAVSSGNQLVEIDLQSGVHSVRSVTPFGLYLGPPSVRAGRDGAFITIFEQTPNRLFVLTLGPGGQEMVRTGVETLTPVPLPDGGSAPLVARPHVGTLVDGRGVVAFALPSGHVGTVGLNGTVSLLGEVLCPTAGRSAGLVGLTPLERGAFAVTCEGGIVVKVVGSS